MNDSTLSRITSNTLSAKTKPFNDFAIFDISMALVVPVACIAITIGVVVFNYLQPCETKMSEPLSRDQETKKPTKKKSVDTMEMFVQLEVEEDKIGLAKTQ
jgi:hypothetical protein